MEKQEKQTKKRLLLMGVEYSAIGWSISLVLHLLLIGSLMLFTFSRFLADAPGTDDSFTVELTESTGQNGGELEVVPAAITNSAGSKSSEVSVISTPTGSQTITLSEVENSEVNISLENVELTASLEAAGTFNESLAGSDTAGSAGFFGLSSSGSSFVYVIDRSGSMAGEKLSAAIRELCRSVKALNSEVKFYLIFYNDSFLPMNSDRLVSATTNNKNRYLSWTDSVMGDGETNPIEAMKLAISLKPDVIWLLSDGEFPAEAVDEISNANTRKVKINTLAFGDGAGQGQLKNIAAKNNGKFKYIPY